MLKSPKVFQFFVIHCCLFTCHICILFSVSSLPNAFYFVVLVVKMPEMAHDWWNKIILFYSILFYSGKCQIFSFATLLLVSEITSFLKHFIFDTVHALRPEQISVIAAMGDSLTVSIAKKTGL